MAKSLDNVHSEIKADKLKRQIFKDVEKKVIPRVQSSCFAATVLVLHDKFGFGKKRLNKYIEEVYDQFDSIYREYLSFDDIKKCIYDELGIDFDEIEKNRIEKELQTLESK